MTTSWNARRRIEVRHDAHAPARQHRGPSRRGGSNTSPAACSPRSRHRSRTVRGRGAKRANAGRPARARSGASRIWRRPTDRSRSSAHRASDPRALPRLRRHVPHPSRGQGGHAAVPRRPVGQPLEHLRDRTRGAQGDRRGARAARDRDRLRAGGDRVHRRRHRSRQPRRSREPRGLRADRASTSSSRSSSTTPSSTRPNGSARRASRSGSSPWTRTGRSSAGRRRRARPRRHAPRLPDAREQRDRHDRAGRRGRRASAGSAACSRSPTRCRHSARSPST